MIPPILHQVWKTGTIPPSFAAYAESWRTHNPGWQIRLWSDRLLLEFVAEHYPALLSVYCGYPKGVMRADAARYMLLDHFGGIYADLDCECVAPFDRIMAEDRVVLCHEPMAHEREQKLVYGTADFLFNGTMASPKGHPFWRHVLSRLPERAGSNDVLAATGPGLLSMAHQSFMQPETLSVGPASLFAPLDFFGQWRTDADTLSIHHWVSTWRSKFPSNARDRLRRRFHKLRYRLTRRPILNAKAAEASVDPACLAKAAPDGDRIAILVPLLDAADDIEPFLKALGEIDHPGDRIKLVFCDPDGADQTWERLQAAIAHLRGRYRDIVLLRMTPEVKVDRKKLSAGRRRRDAESRLAAVRNHLIDRGLDATDDWALWIDPKVWRFPRNIVARLLAPGRRIVVPNCVAVPGGVSIDRSSFFCDEPNRGWRYFSQVNAGLYWPDPSERGHLHDVRHLATVDLDGVGATTLLVDAALHRGGLRFPEYPYHDLIGAEAFAALARTLGLKPAGLPDVEVLRVPWT